MSQFLSSCSPYLSTSPSPSSAMTTAGATPASASAWIKTALNRNSSLTDKIFEIENVLRSVSGKQQQPQKFGFQQSNTSNNVISTNELDAIFVMIVGDIFGSQAVQASKYGHGWKLASVSRNKSYRDFNSVLTFLGSRGTFLHCIKVLGEAHCLYEYPTSRLPYRTPLKPNNLGIAPDPSNQVVLLSPLEYYLYHFMAHINQSSDFYHHGSLENESVYPVLLEDYFSTFLPMGGGHFRFVHREFNQALHTSSMSSPGSGTSLFKNDVWNTGSNSTPTRPKTSPMSSEVAQSTAFVNTLTSFWLRSWAEEAVPKHEATQMHHHQMNPNSPKLPSEDVVKMIRMTVKHLHFFLNSFHHSQLDIRDSLISGLFREFLHYLFGLLDCLLDHWPLDASFRLVLETQLSFIQPWRYRDQEATARGDTESGVFQPGPWDKFIEDHFHFYDDLLYKILNRFIRMDLASNKNAFMLFRVAKVYSQDGLPAVLKRMAKSKSIQSPNFSEKRKAAKAGHLFGDDFRTCVSSLYSQIFQAKINLVKRQKGLQASKDQAKAKESTLSLVLEFLMLTEESTTINSMTLEIAEIDKTLENLDLSINRLALAFDVSYDDQLDHSLSVVDGGLATPQKVHNELTTMTPQKRWEIVNKLSKYSPKYYGNPDEAPLQSDEFHFLARLLYRLSKAINESFNIPELYESPGFAGLLARQLCQPSLTIRASRLGCHGGQVRYTTLPPRITLRPLARYRNVFYSVLLYSFIVTFGSWAAIKIGFFFAVVWILRTALMGLRESARIADVGPVPRHLSEDQHDSPQ